MTEAAESPRVQVKAHLWIISNIIYVEETSVKNRKQARDSGPRIPESDMDPVNI